jgi:N-methylhydantoinase B
MNVVLLEILWARLLAIVNEQQTALIRTAFSTVVRESQDLACGVFDARGQMLAQSLTGTPGHINAMATGVIHFLRAYPPETLVPGDVLVTNDPWQTAGQVNDFTVLTPVFRGGRVVAYFANTCHAPDVGGRLLSAEAREVFEEGLRVPITRLFSAGHPNEELFKLIRANVRTPDETVGDLYAQAACNAVGADRLSALMDSDAFESLETLGDEIVARSERALRAAIAALPDGVYQHRVWSDGFEAPIELCCTATIAGEAITLDFSGSSPQSARGINVVLNYTRAYASFAIKAALCPDVPHNEGTFRPVTVTAPEGSILNCRPPAAVASRHILGHFIPGVIFGALAQAGVRVPAPGADAVWISVWRGEDRGRPFTFTLFQCGGMGARPDKDGLATTGFPSGVAGVPAEVIETLTPLVVERRELLPDSGGAGARRGGLGQRVVIRRRGREAWGLSAMIDRLQHPAPGRAGGQAGHPGAFLINGQPAAAKQYHALGPEDRVTLCLPGGGGLGDARARDPERVHTDLLCGYISAERANDTYGLDAASS